MSNHLGDTNKMVSETPRMDASAHDDGAIWQTGCDIERELNAANAQVDRLTAKVAQLYEGAEEQTQRIKRLEDGDEALSYSIGLDLQKENDALKQRIKRLEEAGDAMEQWTSEYGPIYRWRKAKEDKL